ncbi:MAG: hypothetical protein K2R98_19960 [Gemmataceae bacterium]|nr:hypothetical protein [Gemmataceae bacterium]
MPITCICPQCQKTLAIGDEFAGQAMRCPLCMALFQAPAPQAPVPQGAPASAPAPEPQPGWMAPGNGPQIPYGPVWGGIGETRPRRSPTAGGAEFNGVTPAGSKLDPGWHMVRRGLNLIPISLFIVFLVLAGSRAFLAFASPGPKVTETVLLISIPIAIISTVVAMLGTAMCCLVPGLPVARKMAIGSTGCLAGFLLVGLFTLGVTSVIPTIGERPGERAAGSQALSVLVPMAYLPAGLLLVAGTVLFLLFLRAIAAHFNNRRIGQGALWCAGFVAASPLVLLFIILLLWLTSRAIGGDGTGLAILVAVVVYGFVAVDLFWFLRVLREVRGLVLRGFISAAS